MEEEENDEDDNENDRGGDDNYDGRRGTAIGKMSDMKYDVIIDLSKIPRRT